MNGLYAPLQIIKHKYKMTKADLVARIADKTKISKVDVLTTLETFFKEVKESLAEGENIYVRGFGSFVTKKRAEKIGRNIKKNQAMVIPAHYAPAFKPARVFIDEVKKNLVAGANKKVTTQ